MLKYISKYVASLPRHRLDRWISSLLQRLQVVLVTGAFSPVMLMALAGCATVKPPDLYYQVSVVNATNHEFERFFVFIGDKYTYVAKNVVSNSGGNGHAIQQISGVMKFQWSREGESMKVMEIPASVLPKIDEATKSLNFYVHDQKIVITQTTYDAGRLPDAFATGSYATPRTTTKQVFEKQF